MDEVVEALEGQIAPMECFHETPEGKVLCSHETDGDHACATKLLWTRVQGGVARALAGTTLAELVEFAEPGADARRDSASAAPPEPRTRRPNQKRRRLAELEIRNLHVSAEDKEILQGLDLDVEKGKIHALMGPNGSGKSTLANAIMGHPALEVTEGTITFKGEDMTEADPDERSRAGLFMAFQYPVAIPGVTVSKYLRMIVNARREAQGETEIKIKDFAKHRPRGDGAGQHPRGLLQPLPQRGLLRRREEAHGAAAAGAAAARDRGPRRDRLGPRHRRPAHRRRRRQQVRRPRHGRPDHHPLPAHPPHGEAGLRARHVRGPDRQGGRPGARRAARGEGLRLDQRGGRGGASPSLEHGADDDGQPAAAPSRSRRSAPPSRRSSARSTAGRSPTSTAAPARSGCWPRSRRSTATSAATTPTSTAARTRSRPRRPPPTRAPGRPSPTTSAPPTAARSIFVRNATEAINLVARAWGDANVGEGDRIVLTEMEHHSNIVPWQQLAERIGAEIDWVPVDDDGAARPRRARRAARARPEAGRGHPRLQRARHREPDRRDRPPGPRGGRAGARRRRPGGAEAAARRRRARGRLLRGHRPQALRADRDRRPLGRGSTCCARCRRSSAAAR